MNDPSIQPTPVGSQHSISFPPGFAGRIAKYLFNAAPRPNHEAAIAGTLGLLAGVNGGSYTVSQPETGLNLYIALVMKSAIGKESMSHAVWLASEAARLMHTVIPGAYDIRSPGLAKLFVINSRPASEPALIGLLGNNPSHAEFQGEIGLLVEQLSAAGPTSPLHGLKRLFLDLYDKSGPHQQINGITYSDPVKNKDAIDGPAFSLAGNTTADTFYGSVTADSTEGGFLSRWTVIERKSIIRPPRNTNVVTTPSRDLLGGLAVMLNAAVVCREIRPNVPVTVDAEELLDQFDLECDAAINATADDAKRSAHNRSYLKVLRTAGLLAVAEGCWEAWLHMNGLLANPPQLRITDEQVEWAVELERSNIKSMTTRMDAGDVGLGDDARQKKIIDIIFRYFTSPGGKYEALRSRGVIADQYLQTNTTKVACFVKHKSGSANTALKATVQQLRDAGHLKEVDSKYLLDNYGFKKQGKCYMAVSLPGYETWMNDPVNLGFFWRG